MTEYLDPVTGHSMGGVGADVYSAYSAKLLDMPGTNVHYKYDAPKRVLIVFRAATPVFSGTSSSTSFRTALRAPAFEDILSIPSTLPPWIGRIRFRLNSTAIDIRHAGSPDDADHVAVTYHQEGKVRRVKARSVVISIGGWVARNIVSDMPESIRDAYDQFYHSPVLVVNVALRNWRFLDKLAFLPVAGLKVSAGSSPSADR